MKAPCDFSFACGERADASLWSGDPALHSRTGWASYHIEMNMAVAAGARLSCWIPGRRTRPSTRTRP